MLKKMIVVAVGIALLSSVASAAFYWPCNGKVTSIVGYRYDPISHARKFHNGTDIANSYGTRIGSMTSGKVSFAGWDRTGGGNSVCVQHAYGYKTFYAHMKSISVRRYQTITAKQRVGYMGSTGYSTGPHTHFIIWRYSTVKAPRAYAGQRVYSGARLYLR
ncbi:MAG: M23 family metallopeptidase [Elusimicrobiota bacterium]